MEKTLKEKQEAQFDLQLCTLVICANLTQANADRTMALARELMTEAEQEDSDVLRVIEHLSCACKEALQVLCEELQKKTPGFPKDSAIKINSHHLMPSIMELKSNHHQLLSSRTQSRGSLSPACAKPASSKTTYVRSCYLDLSPNNPRRAISTISAEEYASFCKTRTGRFYLSLNDYRPCNSQCECE